VKIISVWRRFGRTLGALSGLQVDEHSSAIKQLASSNCVRAELRQRADWARLAAGRDKTGQQLMIGSRPSEKFIRVCIWLATREHSFYAPFALLSSLLFSLLFGPLFDHQSLFSAISSERERRAKRQTASLTRGELFLPSPRWSTFAKSSLAKLVSWGAAKLAKLAKLANLARLAGRKRAGEEEER